MDFKGGQSLRDLEMGLRRWDVPAVPCEGWQDGSEWMVALRHPKNAAPTLWFMAPCPEQQEQSWRAQNEKNSNNDPFQEKQFFSQVFLPFSNHN